MSVAGMVLRSSVRNARMSQLLRSILAIAFVLVPTAALDAGGWAVITVMKTPDSVAAGQPIMLIYAVRQHGQTLLNGLQGRVVARFGDLVVQTSSAALPDDGHYAAVLTLPRAGAWTLDIESGFHGSTGQAALVVIEPGSRVPERSREARGQQLFVSKGCARCHLENWSSAPRLNPKGYEAGYLTRFLTSPPAPRGDEWRMPNLRLTADEVESLVAFINAAEDSEDAVVVEPMTCNVTRANGQGTFIEGMSPDLHGNVLISTGLWPDGTIVFRPGGPGFVTDDGALGIKWG